MAETNGEKATLQRKDSMNSSCSKSSKRSNLTLSSKISGLIKRNGFYNNRGPRSTTHSVGEMVDLAVGDQCETISIVTVRAEESIESAVVIELATNTSLEVIELGEGRRIKVSTTATSGAEKISGWISSKTKLNEPLVMKLRPDAVGLADFEVGGTHAVKSVVTMRQEEGLDSEIVCDLQPGTVIKVLALGTLNTRRSKVAAMAADGTTVTAEGWISTTTKTGEVLIGKVGDDERRFFGGTSSKIKMMLECARSGDMTTLKSVCEGSSMMSRFSSRPNLNASDLRGKTALIYGAAFGNKEVVEYLLTKEEVDVNCLDDTHKSALHHASKRAQSRRNANFDEIQASIVNMLVKAGAHVEAREHYGCTPLMFAVAAGDIAVTKMLLMYNARVDVRDFEGHAPLDYARNFQHEAMERLLLDHGAKPEEEEEEVAPLPAKADKPAAGATPKKKVVKKKVASKAGAKKAPGKDAPAGKRRLSGGGKMVPMMSTAMMAAGDDEVHTDVKVEDAAKEEEDDKTRTLRKLALVLETVQLPKELEVALQNAEQAGAEDKELEQARAKLKELKALALARSMLQAAVAEKDVPALKEALAKAKEAKVSQAEISAAQKVLQVEEPKAEALNKLNEAQKTGKADQLRTALAAAKKVGCAAEDLQEFEDLLAGAESKDKAVKALKEATDSRDVVALKFAIQQAKDAGVDKASVDAAEAILKEEEPKQKAREEMEAAMDSHDVARMRKALENAKSAGLDKSETEAVEAEIHAIEEQHRLLELVKTTVAAARACDRTSLESVRAAKKDLQDAFDQAQQIGVSEVDLQEADILRKKMHNLIEDLKGSIRVFCRVRPLSKKETAQGDKDVVEQVNSMTVSVGSNQFSFDSVFVGKTKQEDVFEDCKDLVQSAVDGYNVTLFAYGQTGSGKTFTMEGVRNEDAKGKITGWNEAGVTPRVIDEIFRVIKQNEHRFTFTVLCSMVELYRQDLVDLLTKGNPAASKQKLAVRVDPAGNVTVEHLTSEQCDNADDLRRVFIKGVASRKVTATAMNSDSSRSHLVCVVSIISVNHETKEQTRGKMLLVDLAGSERLKKSQTTGDEQKESIEINKSLTALGDVIEALTKKGKVIPYRNHKLTQLMQDSLGGSAKTLMFVNASPASSNEDETLMSLKYAQRAKMITNTVEKKK